MQGVSCFKSTMGPSALSQSGGLIWLLLTQRSRKVKNRALFRVADLLDLARLVDQLGKGKSATTPGGGVR